MEHKCTQEERIRCLEANKEQSNVYLKIIREDIAAIKDTIKELAEQILNLTRTFSQAMAQAKAQTPTPINLGNIVMKLLEILMYALGALAVLAGAKTIGL